MEENYGYVFKEKPTPKVENKYYYVPLRQVKENQNLRKINELYGYEYNLEDEVNVVKNDSYYNIKVIVSYNEKDNYAQEILTGKLIPVITINIKETDKGLNISKNHFTNETLALYILEKEIQTQEKLNEKMTFCRKNEIYSMDYTNAKNILESYQKLYNKEIMESLLNNLIDKGNDTLNKIKCANRRKIKEKEKQKKYLRSLLDELKNQS